MRTSWRLIWITSLLAVFTAPRASAQKTDGCAALPDPSQLKSTLTAVVKEGAGANSGLGNQEWAAFVNRDGIVCAIVFSGPDRGSQWPGSRVIAAVKASTANAFSTSNYALSTANLYAPAQPGGSLYGIVSPPNAAITTSGDPASFGQANDPMVGKAIGGVIVFGGGLALYDNKGKIIGGLGVSGDTACADHVVAWKTRHALKLDSVPLGAAPGPSDNMILDISNGVSASGYGHVTCKGGQPPDDIVKSLNNKVPVGAKR